MSTQSKAVARKKIQLPSNDLTEVSSSSKQPSGWDAPEAASSVERHSILVDKKFREGLSEEEAKELEQVNALLDSYDAPFYEPIIERLRALHEQLTQSSQTQSETK